VVLPQLDVRVRPVGVRGLLAQRRPVAVVGTIVQAVKSVAIPITSAGSTPAASIAAGTAVRRTAR
jgi:hypothetical protein